MDEVVTDDSWKNAKAKDKIILELLRAEAQKMLKMFKGKGRTKE